MDMVHLSPSKRDRQNVETAMETRRTRKPFSHAFSQSVVTGFLITGALGYGSLTQAAYKNVPRMCCSGAVCFGAYTAIDYAMVSARGKEEPLLDCAVAAAGAAAITALPRGVRYAGALALIGGAGGVVLGGVRLLEDGGPNKLNRR